MKERRFLDEKLKYEEDILTEPAELIDYLDYMNLKGRCISNIYVFGVIYNIGPYWLYGFVRDPEDWWDDDHPVGIRLKLDKPIVIEFDDGSGLGLEVADGGCFRLRGITNAKTDYRHPILDTRRFFSVCAEDPIIGYSVEECDKPFTFFFNLPEQESYIEKLSLDLASGNRIIIDQAWGSDYWDFYLADEAGKMLTL